MKIPQFCPGLTSTIPYSVIPVQTGIQSFHILILLDSRFRGNDGYLRVN